MKARPILFSAPMVRALLDGRKTQTRRVVKPQPHHGPVGQIVNLGGAEWAMDDGDLSGLWTCPYGATGDLLWVRESWRYINHQNGPRGFEVCIGYEADGDDLPNRPSLPTGPGWEDKVDSWPYRTRRWPSIHMPRWASRLTLEITDIRVERLQTISDADARAEGIVVAEHDDGRLIFPVPGTEDYEETARAAYLALWNKINGAAADFANPWVWALTFRVHRANVAAVLAERGL